MSQVYYLLLTVLEDYRLILILRELWMIQQENFSKRFIWPMLVTHNVEAKWAPCSSATSVLENCLNLIASETPALTYFYPIDQISILKDSLIPKESSFKRIIAITTWDQYVCMVELTTQQPYGTYRLIPAHYKQMQILIWLFHRDLCNVVTQLCA